MKLSHPDWRAEGGPGLPIDSDWAAVLDVMGPDLPLVEWARRIGCSVREVERMQSTRVRRERAWGNATYRELRAKVTELESSNDALRALVEDAWTA